MKNRVSEFLSIAFVTASLALSSCARKPEAPPSHSPYKNLIAGLKKIGKSKANIILAETNHSSPEIKEVEGDPDLLKAVKELGNDVIVHEGPLSENQGREKAVIKKDEEQLQRAVVTILGDIVGQKIPGFKDGVKYSYDEILIKGLDEDVKMLKADKFWGWDKDKDQFYSYEFLDHLNKKIEEFQRTGGSEKMAAQMRRLVDAMKYVKDAGEATYPITLTTRFEQMCSGEITPEKMAASLKSIYGSEANPEAGKRWELAHMRLLANACRAGLKIYYPDPGYGALDNDPALDAYFGHLSAIVGGSDMISMAKLQVRLDAELNADQKLRAIGAKMNSFSKDRVYEDLNRRIVENARKATGKYHGVYMYGEGHGDLLRQALGPEKTAVISLFATPESVNVGDIPGREITMLNQGLPQYFYIISTDTLTEVKPGTASEQAYRAKMRNSLTRDEYNAAVKALPVKLKDFALPYSEYDADPNNNILPLNWLETTAVYR